MNEEQVRQIIREELQNFLNTRRYLFQKNISIADGRNIQTGRTTGTKIAGATEEINTGEKIAFFGVTPTVQFPWNNGNNNGEVGNVIIGSGNAIKDDTTFAGNNSVGTRYYTVGDIVTALKKIGILDQTE